MEMIDQLVSIGSDCCEATYQDTITATIQLNKVEAMHKTRIPTPWHLRKLLLPEMSSDLAKDPRAVLLFLTICLLLPTTKRHGHVDILGPHTLLHYRGY